MKLFKSIIISLMLFFSLGAYAAFAGVEKLSPQKYETKSEILNFNYEEMAYPTKGINIGIQTESKVPVVRKPGKQLTEEEIIAMRAETLKNAASIVISFIILVFGVMGMFITISLIAHGILFVIRKKKEFKEYAKKTT
jgi:putative exporter of polyketide antibiotics